MTDQRPESLKSREWKKYSREFLKTHPVCACGNPSAMTTHRVPTRQGGDFWDSANHVAVCRPCGSRRGARLRDTNPSRQWYTPEPGT